MSEENKNLNEELEPKAQPVEEKVEAPKIDKKKIGIFAAIGVAVVAVIVALIVALGGNGGNQGGNEGGSEGGSGAVEKDYTLSIGVVVKETLASSKIAQNVAVLVTDADGKIVLCRLDCIEYSAYGRDGAIVATATSKVAQGDAYDSYSPMAAGRWYQQAQALESYVVGKTKAEVATVSGVDGYAADADLKASCSINIADLLSAINAAFDSEHTVAFKSDATALTAGLDVAAKVTVSEKEDEETNTTTTNIKVATEYASAVLADGKVVAAILDTAEPELVNVTADGSDSFKFAGSKRAQGDAYDSFAPMAGGRWYQQADAYAKSAVGLTKDNIATLASEGVAGCTIGVASYKSGIEAAVKNAR